MWEVPWDGVLEFVYFQTKLDPASAVGAHLAAKPHAIQGVLQLVRERASSLGAPSGHEFLRETAIHMWFVYKDALSIVQVFGSKEFDHFDLAAAWAILYPRVISFADHRDAIWAQIPDKARAGFLEALGPMWHLNPENPTGHYRLNLSIESHRQCALRLQEYSNIERKARKAAGLFDLSQKGNGENWRNEKHGKRPFTANESYLVPTQGAEPCFHPALNLFSPCFEPVFNPVSTLFQPCFTLF